MTKHLKAHRCLLKKLKRCKPKERKEILKKGGKPLQLCLQECAINVLNGNVPLTKTQFKRLSKYKQKLRLLGKKRTSQKKKLDIEQRGGFLSALLAPVVGSLLGAIFKK